MTPMRPSTAKVLCLIAAAALLSTAACASRPKTAVANDGVPSAGASSGAGTTAPTGAVTGAPEGSAEHFRQAVEPRVYFDLDSHEIRADARPRLDAQAAWLRRYPDVPVRIEGNADERGTSEYNISLGARRAEAIRTYLIAAGVAPSRIEVISYGKERPIAAGSTEAAHAQNRNGHTVIIGGR